jgi:uncharacterized membrane protein YccC
MANFMRLLTRHRLKMVHAVRMTAASVTALILAHPLGLSGGLWAVITAIIVTQSNVGSSLKVAFEQFAGSLISAVYATAIVLAIAPDDLPSSMVALVLTLAPTTVLAAFSAGFRIAPITGAIILLGGAGSAVGPLGFASGRIVEVGLGCGAGILVSVLIVPIQASRLVLEAAADTATLMARQLEALASGGETSQAEVGRLAVRIREGLRRLETLVDEAARERRTWLTSAPDEEPLLRTMVRLRHDLGMLRRAVRNLGRDALPGCAAEAWRCAAETGAATLSRLGQTLSGRQAREDAGGLAEAVRAYRAALDEMTRTGLTQPLSTAALGRLFGIGFALEQFRRDLDDLIERSREISASRAHAGTTPTGISPRDPAKPS